MNIHILTIFPEIFSGFLKESILARAIKNGSLEVVLHDLRNWGIGRHKTLDDTPYGGGTGMVLMAAPIYQAIQDITQDWDRKNSRIILMTPQGQAFGQAKAKELTGCENLLLICGRYEGFDERISDFVDEEISLGDFVLNGGEVAAMAITEAVFRLLPRVLVKSEAVEVESFEGGLLEYPQYTRPEEFMGRRVPEILLSGNHALIAKWRNEQALEKTKKRRPDLLRGDEC